MHLNYLKTNKTYQNVERITIRFWTHTLTHIHIQTHKLVFELNSSTMRQLYRYTLNMCISNPSHRHRAKLASFMYWWMAITNSLKDVKCYEMLTHLNRWNIFRALQWQTKLRYAKDVCVEWKTLSLAYCEYTGLSLQCKPSLTSCPDAKLHSLRSNNTTSCGWVGWRRILNWNVCLLYGW